MKILKLWSIRLWTRLLYHSRETSTSKNKTVLNNKRRVTVLINVIMLREILKNYTSINVLN